MSKRLQIVLIIVLALCLAASALALVACSQLQHTHSYGEWQEETAATCTKSGKRTRTCTECGEEETETVKLLGHSWDDGEVTLEPNCERAGKMLYTCTREGCSATKTATIDPLGHDWQEVKEIKAATCEENGLRSAVCNRCDAKEEEQVVNALGHKWDGGVQTQAPDCEHQGEKVFTCTRDDCGKKNTTTLNALGHSWGAWLRTAEPDCTTAGSEKHVCTRANCNKTETRTVDPLGHSLGYEYVIDKQPTVDEAGSKSRRCTRAGCGAIGDVQTIPQLDKDTPMDYTVTITDPCGLLYRGVATIQFYDKDGLVNSTQITTSSYGSAKVSLGTNNYIVKLTGLNDGYSAEAEYELWATNPKLTVKLSTKFNTGTKPQLPFYKEGAILYDEQYSYFDPNGDLQTTTLGEILKQKKGILMNFYFDGCPPCNSEMPALIAASRDYAADVQVLMVNYNGYGDTDTTIKGFQERHSAIGSPLWFLDAETSRTVYRDFASVVKYFPSSAFIDCNGQVVTIHVGSMTQASFKSMMQTYIVNRYATLRPTEAMNDSVETKDYTIVAILPTVKFD